jgi:hypothetical protein
LEKLPSDSQQGNKRSDTERRRRKREEDKLRVNIMGNRCWRIAAFVLLVSILPMGCNKIFATPINKILENPRDYDGKPVKISGEVTEVFGLVVVKYFVVKDKTGEIIVVTKRPLPREGTKITVKGKVQNAFSIGDKQLIVIVENEEQ